MKDEVKSKAQLIEEIKQLQAKVIELQKVEARVKALEMQIQEQKMELVSTGKAVYYELSDILAQIPNEAGAAQKNLHDFQTSSLSAVLGLMNTRGGTVNIVSRPGDEMIFTIRLPAKSQIEKGDATCACCTPGKTILVVDDEEMILNLGKDILEEAGYTVLTAKDGVEALEIFERCRDDLAVILMDMTMPRLNGKETYSRLVEIDDQIPVIFSSGFDEEKFYSNYSGMKPQGYLKKPYSPKGLLDKISSVIKNN